MSSGGTSLSAPLHQKTSLTGRIFQAGRTPRRLYEAAVSPLYVCFTEKSDSGPLRSMICVASLTGVSVPLPRACLRLHIPNVIVPCVHQIIPKGWNGYPTTIYTSTFTGPLGSTSSPAETEGTEAQSMAYTKDGGATWIKLDFGVNPIIRTHIHTLN